MKGIVCMHVYLNSKSKNSRMKTIIILLTVATLMKMKRPRRHRWWVHPIMNTKTKAAWSIPPPCYWTIAEWRYRFHGTYVSVNWNLRKLHASNGYMERLLRNVCFVFFTHNPRTAYAEKLRTHGDTPTDLSWSENFSRLRTIHAHLAQRNHGHMETQLSGISLLI